MKHDQFTQQFKQMPLVAILRGVTPEEVVEVAQCIYDAGITIIEVPMNSPNPIESIANLAQAQSMPNLVCGGGTMTTIEHVEQVHKAGGKLLVSPNFDANVLSRALELDMIAMPGIATLSEGFAAIHTGSKFLKLFPAGGLGSNYLKNIMAVIPTDIQVLAVGGINASNLDEYWKAGARGFGIGGDLYKPGKSLEAIEKDAKELVEVMQSIQTNN